MAGRVRVLLDAIIAHRCQGNKGLVASCKIKLIMKGVDPDQYDDNSPDDPLTIRRVEQIAREMGVPAEMIK